MEKNRNEEVFDIDLLRLFQAMLAKAWLIVVSVVLCAALSFCYAAFLVSPTYEANALLFVNNNTISFGGTSLLLTGDDLISTYSVILKSRLTLNDVIDDMGLPYDYKTLKGMVSSSAVDGTQIFQIKVTSTDPKEAEEIANKLADIMPDKITAVMDGCSVRVVDYAVVPTEKVTPNISRYTMVGALVGFALAAAVILLQMLNDTQIHGEEYLEQRYNIPVLTTIPDLLDSTGGSYYQKNAYQEAAQKSEKSERAGRKSRKGGRSA